MGRPKALLLWEGETFLDRLIGVLAPHCDPVIAALGHDAAAVRAAMRREAVVVVNPHPQRGQSSTLACGLEAVPAGVQGFLFTPVDHPAVRAETVGLLIAALAPPALIAVPRYAGRHGHPVCCAISLKDEFLASGADAPASDVIHRHRGRTVYVDAGDPGVIAGVNTPGEYRRLLEGTS